MFTALLPLIERAPVMLLISREADAGVRVSVTQRSPDSRPSLSVVVTGTTEELDRDLVAALLSHLDAPPSATTSIAAQVGEQVAANAAAAEDDDTPLTPTKPPAPAAKAKAAKAAKPAVKRPPRPAAKPHPTPVVATVPDKTPARPRRRTASAPTPAIDTKETRAELLTGLRVAFAQHGPDVTREQFLEMFPTTGRRYERHFPGGWKAFRAAERGEEAAPTASTPPPAPDADAPSTPPVDDKTLDPLPPTPAAAVDGLDFLERQREADRALDQALFGPLPDNTPPDPEPAGDSGEFGWVPLRDLDQQQAAADPAPPPAPTPAEDVGAAFVAGVIDGGTQAPTPAEPDPTEPTMLDLYGPTT